MKILSATEIREWDQYTIHHEPVTSINLMERAAEKCFEWLQEQELLSHPFTIFCGKGNNGGDGLAIARMLAGVHCKVVVYILEFGHKGTDDFQLNLERLHQANVDIRFIQTADNFHAFMPGEVIIDALFGTGLNRPLEGVTEKLVTHINNAGCRIISIDIPSGLATDSSSKGHTAIHADDTLTFQCHKPALLVAENQEAIGRVHVLDIGLHPAYYNNLSSKYELTDDSIIHSLYKPRSRFSHKGTFGHALIVAGSYGKIGAAVLSSKACLRSGAGLLTCHVPRCGYEIMQSAIPEAMVMTDFNSSFNTKIEEDLSKFDAIGIGPGIGTASETRMLLQQVFTGYQGPLVIDADALNGIALQKDLCKLMPAGSILTPHPKEFERLFGTTANEFERIDLAISKATELNIVIVLKGHHTLIASPNSTAFFNSTGNAGMATAGSGDVLTGVLTALLAQGYRSTEAAILGVYLHGLAGDMVARENSQEAIIASDIIQKLGKAFLELL